MTNRSSLTHSRSWRRWLCACVGVIAFLPVQGYAVPFYKICVFSDVKGRVVLDGKPVANAIIRRKYYVGTVEQKGNDTTRTDAEGRFSMPELWRNSLTAWMSANPMVFQEINIEYGDQQYLAWLITKSNYRVNGELFDPEHSIADTGPGRRKIRLVCDLKDPEIEKKEFEETYSEFKGICRVVEDESP